MTNERDPFGYEAHRQRLCDYLREQTRFLDLAIHRLTDGGSDQIGDVISLMIQAIGSSINSTLALSRALDLPIRDTFGIARSVVEQSTNVAYIMVAGQSAAKAAKMHALQRSYRDLNRTLKIGGTELSLKSPRPGLTPEAFPEIREALDAFTDKKGKPIREWTSVSLPDRITAVTGFDKKAGLMLQTSYFSIYASSSEILHGSYYGSIMFWGGMGRAPRSRDEFKFLALTTHFLTVFTAIYFSVDAMLIVFARHFQMPELADLLQRQLESIISYLEIELTNVQEPARG